MDNTCGNVIDVVDGHSGQNICQNFAALDTKHDHICGRWGGCYSRVRFARRTKVIPWNANSDSFKGGPISVNYSIQKL